MTRGILPIKKSIESGYEVEAAEREPNWLPKSKDLQTAPEQARKRQADAGSFLDNLRQVLHNKPKYSTVADVVNDMRERTGLNKYLSIIANSEGETIKSASQLKDIVNSIQDQVESDGQKEDEALFPESLKKYKGAEEDITNYLRNVLEYNESIQLSVPQLQYDILETFKFKYGLNSEDVLNKEVQRYLSNLIAMHGKDVGHKINPHIGKGVGSDLDISDNSDYFSILNPAQQ